VRQRKASEGSSTETERSSAFWHGRMEVIRLCRGAILGFLAMHWIGSHAVQVRVSSPISTRRVGSTQERDGSEAKALADQSMAAAPQAQLKQATAAAHVRGKAEEEGSEARRTTPDAASSNPAPDPAAFGLRPAAPVPPPLRPRRLLPGPPDQRRAVGPSRPLPSLRWSPPFDRALSGMGPKGSYRWGGASLDSHIDKTGRQNHNRG